VKEEGKLDISMQAGDTELLNPVTKGQREKTIA
jgi:hypothetical protein